MGSRRLLGLAFFATSWFLTFAAIVPPGSASGALPRKRATAIVAGTLHLPTHKANN